MAQLLFAFFFFDNMLTRSGDAVDVFTDTVTSITASNFSADTAVVVLVLLFTVVVERVATLLRSSLVKWLLLVTHCAGWHIFLFIYEPLTGPQFPTSFAESWSLCFWCVVVGALCVALSLSFSSRTHSPSPLLRKPPARTLSPLLHTGTPSSRCTGGSLQFSCGMGTSLRCRWARGAANLP